MCNLDPSHIVRLTKRYGDCVVTLPSDSAENEPMNQLTNILAAIESGEPNAESSLIPLIYEELHKLATQKLMQEKPGQTLQATDLVNEAYLRLFKTDQPQHWNSRGHFFSAAAEAMQRILIDQARRRLAAKRGGQIQREELHESRIVATMCDEKILELNDALEQLALVDKQAANMVRLRFFTGLNMNEVAEALSISVRSAYDLWAYARSWLKREMEQ